MTGIRFSLNLYKFLICNLIFLSTLLTTLSSPVNLPICIQGTEYWSENALQCLLCKNCVEENCNTKCNTSSNTNTSQIEVDLNSTISVDNAPFSIVETLVWDWQIGVLVGGIVCLIVMMVLLIVAFARDLLCPPRRNAVRFRWNPLRRDLYKGSYELSLSSLIDNEDRPVY